MNPVMPARDSRRESARGPGCCFSIRATASGLSVKTVSLPLFRETGTELLDAGRPLLARRTGRLGLVLPSTCEAPTQADRRADPSAAALRLWRISGFLLRWAARPAFVVARVSRRCHPADGGSVTEADGAEAVYRRGGARQREKRGLAGRSLVARGVMIGGRARAFPVRGKGEAHLDRWWLWLWSVSPFRPVIADSGPW
jgi:hypothetical protein